MTRRLEILLRSALVLAGTATLVAPPAFAELAGGVQEERAGQERAGQRKQKEHDGRVRQEDQQPQQADPAEPEDQGEEESENRIFRVFWDEGLHLDALRHNFEMLVAGGVQNDSAAFSSDREIETELGRMENGLEWRRARLYARGTIARHLEFKFQYDFAVNDPPHLKDAYLQFNLPVFPMRIRGGRFRTALSLEGYTPASDTTFMERGLISAFLPSRNTGAMIHGDTQRQNHDMRWAFGILKHEDDFGTGSTDRLSFTGRFTYAFHPGREDVLWHVGGDVSHRKVDETLRFLERPESHLAVQFVDTGDILADSTTVGVAEGAIVKGPLSLQGEYAYAYVNSQLDANPRFHGLYTFVSYFITGETRPYVGSRGAFGRVIPKRDFRWTEGGFGALEVAFRFSRLDLNDRGVEGGELADLTAAANWYPTSNARVMFNLIRAKRVDTLFDPVWIAQLRLQWAY